MGGLYGRERPALLGVAEIPIRAAPWAPAPNGLQEYRLVDAATGEFERCYCDVDDIATNQPWADDIPVYVQAGRVTDS
nr:DUF3556 domain-containing protein [Mycobacterium colombiense]